MSEKRGNLFVVSGPSGAGKSTLTNKVVDFFGDLRFSISYTTREPRAGEADGVDYRFVDEARFKEMVEAGEFVEHACVHSANYGTARVDLERMLNAGQDVLLDIDVQGGAQLSKSISRGVYVFVLPPSIEACKQRLEKRGDVKKEHMARRLETALEEIKEAVGDAGNYDYIIINAELSDAFEKLKSIIRAERTRKEAVMDEVKEKFEL